MGAHHSRMINTGPHLHMRSILIASALGLSLFHSAMACAATFMSAVLPSTAAAASYLRFFNPTSRNGIVTVTLRHTGSATVLGTWTQSVPSGASLQTALRDIEIAARVTPVNSSETYTLAIISTFSGYAQHVTWNPARGTLTGMSLCGPARAADGASLMNVHSALIPAYPSSIVITNSGTTARTAVLTVRDSRSGQTLGAWTSSSIAAGASTREIPASEIMSGARVSTGNTLYHVNMELDAAFAGAMQHIVTNIAAGAPTDMTAKCVIGPEVAP